MSPSETILVVDDDDVLRQRLEKSLTRRGWTIFAAEGFETAIALAETHQPTASRPRFKNARPVRTGCIAEESGKFHRIQNALF